MQVSVSVSVFEPDLEVSAALSSHLHEGASVSNVYLTLPQTFGGHCSETQVFTISNKITSLEIETVDSILDI